jgi:hypothetical protein
MYFLFLLGWFCCCLWVYILLYMIWFILLLEILLRWMVNLFFFTLFFDCISLLFMGFVFILYSLVILYSDDYMFGDFHFHRVSTQLQSINIIIIISFGLFYWFWYLLFLYIIKYSFPTCCRDKTINVLSLLLLVSLLIVVKFQTAHT